MCQILSFLCTCDNVKRSCWGKGASGESSRISDGSAEETPATCRASVRLWNPTPHPDPVEPEMLTPQRPYSTRHLPVLTSLVFGCSSQTPCADREGRRTLPSPAHGHKSPLLADKHTEDKKDHCIHMAKRSSGLLESAVSSRLIITTQTDRPGGQTDPQAPGAAWVHGLALGAYCIWKNTSLQRC